MIIHALLLVMVLIVNVMLFVFFLECLPSCMNGGLHLCTGYGLNNESCCSWYLNDVCTTRCEDPYIGDTNTFECRQKGKLAIGQIHNVRHTCVITNVSL